MFTKSLFLVLSLGALVTAKAASNPTNDRSSEDTSMSASAFRTVQSGSLPAELAVRAPPGWDSQLNRQNGVIFMKPPDAPTISDAGLIVFPAVDFNGTAQQFHEQSLNTALQGNRLLEPSRHGTSRGFLISSAHAQTSDGSSVQLVLYTARWGHRAQAILFATARDDLFKSNARTAESVLLKVVVPGSVKPAKPPNSTPAAGETATSESTVPPPHSQIASPPPETTAVAKATGTMPVLNYDEPTNFYRGASKNPYEYTSNQVNFSLCIYPFRAYTGDIVAQFQQTLLRDWMEIRYREENVAGQPVFTRNNVPGAASVIEARFHENIVGLLNERLRILIVAGGMAAVIDVKAANAVGWNTGGPALRTFLSSLKVGQKAAPPSLSGPLDPAGVALAGLYAGTKAKYMAYGLTDFTGHVLARHFFLLSGDGRVFRCYDTPPAGGNWRQFDFDTAQREDPGNTGRFAVRGNQLYIQWGGPNAEEVTSTLSDPTSLQIDSVTYTKQE